MTTAARAPATTLPSDPASIRLTWEEFTEAAICGVERRVERARVGRRDLFDPPGIDPWRREIMGAAAERAVARYLNVYWRGFWRGDERARLRGDVGADGSSIEVRYLGMPSSVMRVRPNEPEEFRYVAVRSEKPSRDGLTFTLVGWCFGSEAKRQPLSGGKYGNEQSHAVPDRLLHPIATLTIGGDA